MCVDFFRYYPCYDVFFIWVLLPIFVKSYMNKRRDDSSYITYVSWAIKNSLSFYFLCFKLLADENEKIFSFNITP